MARVLSFPSTRCAHCKHIIPKGRWLDLCARCRKLLEQACGVAVIEPPTEVSLETMHHG